MLDSPEPPKTFLQKVQERAAASRFFTVSLLIAELAFEADAQRLEYAKTGVLIASLLAAAIAVVLIRSRVRVYARLQAEEDSEAGPAA